MLYNSFFVQCVLQRGINCLNTQMHLRKICSKMITSIIRYHKAIYYIMSITRDRFRPYWVLSGGCKKHSIINMLKNKFAFGCQKNAIQNNMTQQYLYHGGHIQGHTHMTWTTSQENFWPATSNSCINDKS